ncbi:Cof-type HAD-IIB family hydrolase [Halanaerobium hydrogeniformans]|uniref:Cof-like hydrolase n=1 Tax=Halanaerobium hydrogeniformans TaxID=656519 RepID=E4RK62_HALHG|nr:Cof-type HAD-IIB family hydrolase [Halanaerobium hydrogeniformans]ADQ14614.1 Cof-like hydrolase [Halanaerobium hydrogeniformans]
MNTKLLALDLDGTLLKDDLTISSRNKEAIKKARQKGVEVVIATGRPNSAAMKYIEELELDSYLITYNGALIKDLKKDRIVKHSPVELEMSYEILDYVKANDLYLNIYLQDQIFCNKECEERQYYEELMGVEPTLVKNKFKKVFDQQSTKLLIIEKDLEETEKIFNHLSAKYADKLKFNRSIIDCIDIMDKSVSKGNALKTLVDLLGLNSEQLVAIGDRNNDLEMIKYAGVGVAVSSGEKILKDAADYITTSNNEDGVAEYIEKFIL